MQHVKQWDSHLWIHFKFYFPCKFTAFQSGIYVFVFLLYINLPFIYTCRYSLMVSCWFESPIDRPVFSDVAASINTLIEPLAGYLDFADIKDISDVEIHVE